MAKHAILSASGASRWLACPPSARLEEGFPDTTSDYAREGTLAHDLGELLISYDLGNITKREYNKKLKLIQLNDLYQPEMLEHTGEYASYVWERVQEAKKRSKDIFTAVEVKLNLTKWVPEGFGTADMVIIADGILDIVDLKYGKGVPVSAENNPQMMLYSLGALNEYDFMFEIDTVRMTIHQPRLDSISVFEIAVKDLKAWGEEVKKTAEIAFKGEGKQRAGAHCRFCKAKAVCREYASYGLRVAAEEFPLPPTLSDEEIPEMLKIADLVEDWANTIKEYAFNKAVSEGIKWPGFKLVEGRSNRIYSDKEKVAEALTASGYKEDDIYKKELKGITDMTKLLTKKVFDALLSRYIIKPPGKPALVPEDDKRPEWQPASEFDDGFIYEESAAV